MSAVEEAVDWLCDVLVRVPGWIWGVLFGVGMVCFIVVSADRVARDAHKWADGAHESLIKTIDERIDAKLREAGR